jgi:hypothetical protein
VFFQGNPFQPVIPHDMLLLVKEDFAISQCDWNTQWIKECFERETWGKIRDNNIICIEIIAGNGLPHCGLDVCLFFALLDLFGAAVDVRLPIHIY